MRRKADTEIDFDFYESREMEGNFSFFSLIMRCQEMENLMRNDMQELYID